jgi:hypothetical protein
VRLHFVLAALLTVVLATAGCVGQQPAGPTATPLPPGDVDFPDGPKERPDRPETLNASSVRDYVHTYEYRYAYNSLWYHEYSEVTLACRVDGVTGRSWGYEAVVTCTGHSDSYPPSNSTVDPAPHADWFTQSFRYLVGEDATHRRSVEPREPVS